MRGVANSPDVRRRVVRLWNEPQSAAAVARETGLCRRTVISIVRRARANGDYVRAGKFPSQADLLA